MPDLLSLLHDERLLFEKLYAQTDRSSGLSEGEALRCVANDQGRLLGLEQAGLLTAAKGPYQLTPQARALLDALLASPTSAAAPEPATSSPMLLHLRWLETLIERGEFRTQTNVETLLAHHHALPLDGKEQWATRPRLGEVAAMRSHRSQRPASMVEPLVSTEGDDAAPSEPLADWLTLRGDFAQSQADLLSFLRQISQDPVTVADWYRSALAIDAAHLQIHEQSISWAGKSWAHITWQP